jgi:hypothetical protein
MDPFCVPLALALDGLRPRPPRIPIISTATESSGDPCVFDAAYWVRNMRAPVRFAAAIDQLVQDGYSLSYGARFLKRSIEDRIKLPISQRWTEGDVFTVDANDGRIEIEVSRAAGGAYQGLAATA